MTSPHSTQRSPLILPFNGKTPRIHRSAYIAPGVTIIGDVEIGADSSVFYGCVLRGDVGAIRIGERTNIQDNCVLHTESESDCVLGNDVTVGHLALVHACHVGAGTLVGMKSALHDRAGLAHRRRRHRLRRPGDPRALPCRGRTGQGAPRAHRGTIPRFHRPRRALRDHRPAATRPLRGAHPRGHLVRLIPPGSIH